MSKNKKSYKWLIIIFLIVFFVCCFFAYCISSDWLKPNFRVPSGEKAYIFIDNQTDFDDIIEQMVAGDWIQDTASFKRVANQKKYLLSLKTGRYSISDRMNNRTLINHLLSGLQAPVNLRFNNIRTPEQLAGRLSKQLMLDSLTILNAFRDDLFLETYDLTPRTALQLFIPNTYQIYWDVSLEALFNRMKKEYTIFWNDERLDKAQAMGLTPGEIMTLASIVEEETKKEKEQPIVAGLYINRLRQGMLLQADPTVKYAVGNFALAQILFSHTSIDSPYNTYKYVGLPPGPIRMPSISAIDATLNYTKHDYLYMCAKESLNGEHNFAATHAEHQRNAKKYHAALRQWQRQKRLDQ